MYIHLLHEICRNQRISPLIEPLCSFVQKQYLQKYLEFAEFKPTITANGSENGKVPIKDNIMPCNVCPKKYY